MSRKWERDGHKVSAGPTVESRLMHEISKYPQGLTILARSPCNSAYCAYRISCIFIVKDDISLFFNTFAVNGEIVCFLYLRKVRYPDRHWFLGSLFVPHREQSPL